VSHHHLGVYLNNHLAGSATDMALLAELETAVGLTDQVRHVGAEIASDR
jgi:hypothetical protein